MRLLVLPLVVVMAGSSPGAVADDGDRLIAYYARRASYRAVKKDVLAWHRTTRNGCVAFVSTALRHVGVDVPLDAEIDGERVSRLTRPLSRWLEERLGWTRVDDAAALEAGDVVFTEDAAYPWHVYVFHSWADRRRRVARVIDNQGFLRRRPVLGDAARAIEPFAYALRAPSGDRDRRQDEGDVGEAEGVAGGE